MDDRSINDLEHKQQYSERVNWHRKQSINDPRYQHRSRER